MLNNQNAQTDDLNLNLSIKLSKLTSKKFCTFQLPLLNNY